MDEASTQRSRLVEALQEDGRIVVVDERERVAEAIEQVAAVAGLRLAEVGDHHGRWFAVLAR